MLTIFPSQTNSSSYLLKMVGGPASPQASQFFLVNISQIDPLQPTLSAMVLHFACGLLPLPRVSPLVSLTRFLLNDPHTRCQGPLPKQPLWPGGFPLAYSPSVVFILSISLPSQALEALSQNLTSASPSTLLARIISHTSNNTTQHIQCGTTGMFQALCDNTPYMY